MFAMNVLPNGFAERAAFGGGDNVVTLASNE